MGAAGMTARGGRPAPMGRRLGRQVACGAGQVPDLVVFPSGRGGWACPKGRGGGHRSPGAVSAGTGWAAVCAGADCTGQAPGRRDEACGVGPASRGSITPSGEGRPGRSDTARGGGKPRKAQRGGPSSAGAVLVRCRGGWTGKEQAGQDRSAGPDTQRPPNPRRGAGGFGRPVRSDAATRGGQLAGAVTALRVRARRRAW